MKAIVADASVILKWVLPGLNESDVEKALLLRDLAIDRRIAILVPSLMLFEIGNVLSIKEPQLAEKMIKQIMSFDLHECVWTNDWLSKTLWLVNKFQVTFYDASYHALALVEGCSYITSDRQYLSKTSPAGSAIHLRDWKG